jgi:predicted Zn-dependent protease with MMP-like domain
MPEIIVIYQQNIESICRTDEEIVEEVRKTVIHEIGHHFGLSDADMEELE